MGEMCQNEVVFENKPVYNVKNLKMKPRKSDSKTVYEVPLPLEGSTKCPVSTDYSKCDDTKEHSCDSDYDCAAVRGKCCLSNCVYSCLASDNLEIGS